MNMKYVLFVAFSVLTVFCIFSCHKAYNNGNLLEAFLLAGLCGFNIAGALKWLVRICS